MKKEICKISALAGLAICLLASSVFGAEDIVMENAKLRAVISGANGGLKSLSLKSDADKMNWVEGNSTWGLALTREQARDGLDELKTIAFKSVEKKDDGSVVSFYDDAFFSMTVVRAFTPNGTLSEKYEVNPKNNAPAFFNRGDFGIYATFNNSYASADICMTQRCHAHIWCGGEVSFVKAVKMGLSSEDIGLVLRRGSLDSYSVELVKEEIMSNDRGDFILHITPTVIEPNETMKIEWELFAYPDGKFEEFVLKNFPDQILVRSKFDTVFIGESFEIAADCSSEIRSAKSTLNGEAIPVERDGKTLKFNYKPSATGEYVFNFEVNGVKTVAKYICVPKYEDILKKRISFLIEKQQYKNPASPLYGAFLIYDNEDKSPFFQKYVLDHNASRERLPLGIMLARYLRSHKNAEFSKALDLFENFVFREFFNAEDGEVFNTIGKEPRQKRLYNAPWMITFMQELFLLKGDKKYLDYMYKATEVYYKVGGTRFYPNGSIFVPVVKLLRENGMDKEADAVFANVKKHVETMVKIGTAYPKHEVNFEQGIASPAAAIISEYAAYVGDKTLAKDAAKHIAILGRFNGSQPHYRLNGVAIRHWDGYWFGKNRLYGDTFPHQASVLSARAFQRYNKIAPSAELRHQFERCLRNNFCLFKEDGTATAAHIFPYSVGVLDKNTGTTTWRRGEYDDPWANDQDGALYFIIDIVEAENLFR